MRQGPSLQADLLTEAVPRGGLRGLLPAHHCIVGEGLAPGGLSPPPRHKRIEREQTLHSE